MLLGLVRFVRGYVDFEAEGKFPERFLNITARYGINLWEALPYNGGLSGSMYVSDYRNIRSAARKAKVKLKITCKHGLPFILNRYKFRVGIPAGAFAGFIMIMILSNFVWSISISGNKTISEQYLRDILADSGVYTGAYMNSIDVEKVERNIQLNESKVGWISINITGSLASVELKENTIKRQTESSKNPSNLKARCDGVITNINVRSGVTQVKKGSGVAKGDLLVSGVAEKIDERYSSLAYLKSDGEIYADVSFDKEFTFPKNYNYYSISENSTERDKFNFLHISFPSNLNFTTYDMFVSEQKSSSLLLNNVIMPIGTTTQTDYELTSENVTLNDETARNIFENEALLYELSEKSEAPVVNRKLNISQKNGMYVCKIDYIFNENIAENVEFSVTE